jgi:TPR repeat protein
MLPFVLILGGLSGCGAGVSRGDLAAAELEAQSARAEARREHRRVLEMEARLVDLERRLANQRACAEKSDELWVDVPRALQQSKVEPLRSEGDFLAEARVIPPAARPPATSISPGTTISASDPARRQQQLEVLREYERQGGLSRERREALRVLLRRDRQLDLINPWSDH